MIIESILVLSGLGLGFGIFLAFASKKFEVKRDPKIDEVLSVLPGANCGACGYDTCVDHAVAIVKGLAEEEMCLPYTIEKLHRSVKDLALSNAKLTTMQNALKQSEKLAHMGQLSAVIIRDDIFSPGMKKKKNIEEERNNQ